MTEILCHTDSYLREFDAMVTGVDHEAHAILLDRTVFYPGGGGQPSDHGLILHNNQAIHVIRCKKIGDDVFHFFDASAQLPDIGSHVQGAINWEYRYRLMRTHTAMHILCGVVFRDYGASVTGGDMEPLQGRMDFEFEELSKELVGQIESAVNLEIAEKRPIRVQTLPREVAFKIPDLIRTKINLLPPNIQFVRTVEIEGLDLQADGGTHVASTEEVGKIRVIDYKSKGKINKRIYIAIEPD
jgi:misacylated tRNA(Ala) deacylase